MMIKTILILIIGYLTGMISCISQVLFMEKKYDKKLKEIFKDN